MQHTIRINHLRDSFLRLYSFRIVKERERDRPFPKKPNISIPQEILRIGLSCVHGIHQYDGGARRDRTADPLLAKQVLSQLSYGPSHKRQIATRH